jgi:hypothetical protein
LCRRFEDLCDLIPAAKNIIITIQVGGGNPGLTEIETFGKLLGIVGGGAEELAVADGAVVELTARGAVQYGTGVPYPFKGKDGAGKAVRSNIF